MATYKVKGGDSWSSIATSVYGRGSRMFAEIGVANNWQPLRPGMVINIPDKVENPFISNELAASFGMGTSRDIAIAHEKGATNPYTNEPAIDKFGKMVWTPFQIATNRAWASKHLPGEELENGGIPESFKARIAAGEFGSLNSSNILNTIPDIKTPDIENEKPVNKKHINQSSATEGWRDAAAAMGPGNTIPKKFQDPTKGWAGASAEMGSPSQYYQWASKRTNEMMRLEKIVNTYKSQEQYYMPTPYGTTMKDPMEFGISSAERSRREYEANKYNESIDARAQAEFASFKLWVLKNEKYTGDRPGGTYIESEYGTERERPKHIDQSAATEGFASDAFSLNPGGDTFSPSPGGESMSDFINNWYSPDNASYGIDWSAVYKESQRIPPWGYQRTYSDYYSGGGGGGGGGSQQQGAYPGTMIWNVEP